MWQQIQQSMQTPKCQHGEPALMKRVNKSGPNRGRYFYMCARPEGKRPEGRCKFWQWVNGGASGKAGPASKRTKMDT